MSELINELKRKHVRIAFLSGAYQNGGVAAANYVVIDGQRYTDEKLVEAKALEALQNASFTDEDLSNLLFQH